MTTNINNSPEYACRTCAKQECGCKDTECQLPCHFYTEQAEQEPVAFVNWNAATGERTVSFFCESELASEPLYAHTVQQLEQRPLGTAGALIDKWFLSKSGISENALIYAAPVSIHSESETDSSSSSMRTAVRTKDLTEKWIDPNDKSQKQYLPHIGEKVLFCCDGEVYYGHHTGGAFQKGYGVTKCLFPTWDCMWMYLPVATIKSNGKNDCGGAHHHRYAGSFGG